MKLLEATKSTKQLKSIKTIKSLKSVEAIKPLSAGHFLMAFPNSYQKVEHSKKCGRIFKDGAKTSVLIKNESICSVLMHSKKLKDYPFQFLKKICC